jgi:hypothetical protein
MTTREHILANAFLGSERVRRSAIIDHRCILDISDYSKVERARILYNHLYFSDLPVEYRATLISDKFYQQIVDHRNFNPRLIEWLANYRRVKPVPVEAYKKFITGILEQPHEVWEHAFNNQRSASSRCLLLCLFTMGGEAHLQNLLPAWRDLYAHQAEKYNFQAEPEASRSTLKELESAFIQIKNNHVEYINPSIKDFVSGVIVNSNKYTRDLIISARYFGQILRLWQLSSRLGFEQLRQNLIGPEMRLVEAIARCLARPFAQRIEFGGGWATVEHDIGPEARLHGVIMMSDDLRSKEAYSLTTGCLLHMLARWDDVIPDFEETVRILTAFRGIAFGMTTLSTRKFGKRCSTI